ncbi:MAG: hypothetical protein FWC16_12470 [Defluviitaleaceae bacterium]|nr:hypothetical protein [Defluviitaleaceae bacterium]MCL2275735.1 hypothetical protein [Defluviitaleaceae bacterium]
MIKTIDASQLFNNTPAHRNRAGFSMAGAKNAPIFAQGDSVEISEESRRALDERAMFLQWQESAREQAIQARETAKLQAEAHNALLIAFEIAARIMRGDVVPPDDINFLGETSPGLLMMAMSSRSFDNENPEEHDGIAPRENHRPAANVQVVTPDTATPRA